MSARLTVVSVSAVLVLAGGVSLVERSECRRSDHRPIEVVRPPAFEPEPGPAPPVVKPPETKPAPVPHLLKPTPKTHKPTREPVRVTTVEPRDLPAPPTPEPPPAETAEQQIVVMEARVQHIENLVMQQAPGEFAASPEQAQTQEGE